MPKEVWVMSEEGKWGPDWAPERFPWRDWRDRKDWLKRDEEIDFQIKGESEQSLDPKGGDA